MDDYEPFRARSNTWPLPRPDLEDEFGANPSSEENETSDILGSSNENASIVIPTTAHDIVSGQQHQQHSQSSSSPTSSVNGSHLKKNTSRRNAWGNMSYADLITQAIQGSPEKRLTLSQIYEWMVQNIPYFKDKGDSNSSAGWKNSIRHNLSLHNRFMRVQNEGTGKSSWWMINPDAKPGKAARRRATSMETSKFEKKRGRVKKKVEALRNSLIPETHSPSSSVSEGLDHFDESPLHHFNLSPDFRPRASSNASSCGRLSPIPAVEADMHDSQVPPLSPLNAWNTGDACHMYRQDMEPYADQLVESMTNTMKLGPRSYLTLNTKSSPTSQLSPASSQITLTPSGYTSGPYINGNNNNFANNNGSGSLSRNGSDPFFQASAGIESTITLTSLNAPASSGKSPQTNSFLTDQSSATFNLTNLSPSLSPSQSMDTLPNMTSRGRISHHEVKQQHNRIPYPRIPAATKGILSCPGFTNISPDTLLMSRPTAVAVKTEGLPPHSSPSSVSVSSSGAISSLGTTSVSQVMGHLLSLNNSLPNDLDFDSLQGGLECDVNSVIQHELNVDGNLDFNFDPLHGSNASNGTAAPTATSMASASSHSWVH